jgi:hypothetical protein
MINRLVGVNLIFKLLQGFFAYLSIGFQSNSLSTNNFNYLSIIGNAVVLSVFLDLGVGIQFIQNYFKKFSKFKIEDEDSFALSFLKQQTHIFILVAVIQASLVSCYALALTKSGVSNLEIEILGATFIVTFLFSFGGFIARILIARGLIQESVYFQMIGVVTQFLLTVVSFYFNFDLLEFLFTLSVPNVICALLSIRLLRLNARKNRTKSPEGTHLPGFLYDIRSVNIRIQIIQLLQFVIGTLSLLIVAFQQDPSGLTTVMIQWRIFTSVTAALSSLNLSEWRDLSLAEESLKSESRDNLQYFLKKMFLAFVLSFVTSFLCHQTWRYLDDSGQKLDPLSWAIWILYSIFQVFQWHYYYQLISQQEYSKLILGTVVQLLVTVGLLLALNSRYSSALPMAISGGLMISGLFMRFTSRNLNDKNGAGES